LGLEVFTISIDFKKGFCSLQKHLQLSHLARQISKLTIYKTLMRPVLLYGSETWVLTIREENRLLVFERKVLRTIYGPKIVDGVYTLNKIFKINAHTYIHDQVQFGSSTAQMPSAS
jgi:hypothetical protein